MDDHSGVCVPSVPTVRTRSVDVVRVLHKAAEKRGYPEALPTNGAMFTAATRGGVGSMEPELQSLGIRSKHSRPYHPGPAARSSASTRP